MSWSSSKLKMSTNRSSESILHEFIDKKITSGLSVKYVCDIIVVFKSMSRYASKVHDCAEPIRNVVLPKKNNNELRILNDEQQKLLKTSFNDGKHTQLAVMLDKSRNTSSLNIPDVIKYGKIPDDAKYEIENYFNYIIKKYGL